MKNDIKIDRETYRITEQEYTREINPKKQIIIGGTNRKDSNHIIRLTNQKYKSETKWSTYTIDRSGTVYEHFDPEYYSNFTSNEVIDKKSISIMIENMGPLYYNYQSDRYYNFLNEIFDGYEDDTFQKDWRGYRYYESYTDQQYSSLVTLCRYLCDRFGIEYDTYGHNVIETEAPYFNGVITRSNLSMDYNDPNPSLNMGKFLGDLKIS